MPNVQNYQIHNSNKKSKQSAKLKLRKKIAKTNKKKTVIASILTTLNNVNAYHDKQQLKDKKHQSFDRNSFKMHHKASKVRLSNKHNYLTILLYDRIQ